MANLSTPNTEDLVITRVFDAPVERVWRAWSEPDQTKAWWGPAGYTAPSCTIDFRVGGKYLFCMRSPEGQDIWSTGTYREIVPMRRIVSTDSFADEKGSIVPATHYGMGADFPREMIVTVEFAEEGGKTRMTLRHASMPASDINDAKGGWGSSFDKLAAHLAKG